MEATYKTKIMPATPEFVFEILKQLYAESYKFFSEKELLEDTKIDDLIIECELYEGVRLGQALNEELGISIEDKLWKDILVSQTTTMQDLSVLIAPYMDREQVIPETSFGTNCLPAGVFRTIKSILHESGADVDHLRPSTPLDNFTCKHIKLFSGRISFLCPNKFHPIEIKGPFLETISAYAIVAGIFGSFSSMFINTSNVLMTSLITIAIGMIIVTMITPSMKPRYVKIGTFSTFGDLSRFMAQHIDNKN